MHDRSPTCWKQHVFLCSHVSTVQFMQASSWLTTVQESARVVCWADLAAPPVPPSERQNIGAEQAYQKNLENLIAQLIHIIYLYILPTFTIYCPLPRDTGAAWSRSGLFCTKILRTIHDQRIVALGYTACIGLVWRVQLWSIIIYIYIYICYY